MAVKTQETRLTPPEIRSSVITSVCVAPGGASNKPDDQPLNVALGLLKKLKVEYVDLYCFFPGDLPDRVIMPGQFPRNHTVVSRIAVLDVDALLREWRKHPDVEHYLSSGRVRALATNLPNISSPKRQMRDETVLALKNLLTLASMFGCPVLELVAGPDFVLGNDKDARLPLRINTGEDAFRRRRSALVQSLVELSRHTATLKRPVAIALEMEPGLSYLLNSWRETRTILELVDRRLGGDQPRVFLNLDIGHARLLAQKEPDLAENLRQGKWRSRVVHAHISHHDLRAHVADLPLKPHHQALYQPWIDLLVDAWYQGPGAPRASYTIALELEAVASEEDIEQSQDCLNKWVSTSRDRYLSRWTWKPEVGPPLLHKGVVLFLDLVGSSRYVHYQDLSKLVREFISIVQRFEGVYDKFTGDGLMAVFLEVSGSARQRSALAERALKCARDLRHLIDQEFKSLFDRASGFSGSQIGISAGQFMFGDHGLPDRPEVTATGPTVICAARLANDRDLRKDPESAILASNEFILYGNRTETRDRVVCEEYKPTGLDTATKVWMLQ